MSVDYHPPLPPCCSSSWPRNRTPPHHQPFATTPGPCSALVSWRPASPSCNSMSTVYYLHPNKSLWVFPSLREANVPGMWELMPKTSPGLEWEPAPSAFWAIDWKRCWDPTAGNPQKLQGTFCFLPPSFTPPTREVQQKREGKVPRHSGEINSQMIAYNLDVTL